MSRKELLENTIKYLKELPNEKISEVHDFVEYLYQKHEEYILKTGIQKLETESGSFQFLEKGERIRRCAGKTGDDVAAGQPPDLAGRHLHHRLAHGDLAIPRHGHLAVLPHGDDGGGSHDGVVVHRVSRVVDSSTEPDRSRGLPAEGT